MNFLTRFLALSTLGTPAAVTAANLYYYRQYGAANPFQMLYAETYLNSPSLVDVDGDGDYDLVVVETVFEPDFTYRFRLMKNTGSVTAPVFTGFETDYFQSLELTNSDSPAFGRVDGDTDLDLVIGTNAGTFRYFKNTGTASAMTLTELTGAANPFNGIDIGSYAGPAIVDIDGDGDGDVVAGDNNNRKLVLLRNTGTAAAPVFAQQAFAPFEAITIDSRKPAFVDMDGDGDRDLVIDGYNFFTNTGTTAAPVYVRDTVTFVSGGGGSAIADMNGDGKPELFSINGATYSAQGSAPVSSPFTEETNSITQSVLHTAAAGDLDGDGDMDLLAASPYFSDGKARLYRNDGTANAPAWNAWTSGPAFPESSYVGWTGLADVDGDGDLDALLRHHPAWKFYRNTGSPAAPVFTLQLEGADPFKLPSTNETITFGDLDGDGDLDFATGHGAVHFGGDEAKAVKYFRNTGTATAPVYVEQTGAANPLSLTWWMESAIPCFSDMDRDGDLDVIIGGWELLIYLRNDGTRFAPSFTLLTGADSPLAALPVQKGFSTVSPLAGEWKNGGAKDLIVSLWRGKDTPFVKFFTGNNPVTKFSGWQAANFTLPAEAALAAADADPDKDGVVNLIEYAVKTPPKIAGAKPGSVTRTGTGALQLVLDVRDDDPGLSAVGESGATAAALSGSIAPVITDPVANDGMKRWTFTDQPPAGTNLRRFLRARFSLN